MTREDLARRTGIPAASIKDIETGIYKMTPEVAMRVSLATGVHPQSLMRGDDPLWDVAGIPFTRASKKPQGRGRSKELTESISLLFGAVLAAAEEKNATMQFHFLLDAWLSQIVPALGISQEVFEQLNQIADRLEPDFSVPDALLPRERRAKQRWIELRLKLKEELAAEMKLILREVLQQDKTFQSLSESKQEAAIVSWFRGVKESDQEAFVGIRKSLSADPTEAAQKFREKFFPGSESVSEEQIIEHATITNKGLEHLDSIEIRLRRKALDRIAARKRPA